MTNHSLNIKPFSDDVPIMVLRLKRLLLRHSAGIIVKLLSTHLPSLNSMGTFFIVVEQIPMPGTWQMRIRRRYHLDNTYVLSMEVYRGDTTNQDVIFIQLLNGLRKDLERMFDVQATPFSDTEAESELMEFLYDYVFNEEEA